MVFVIFSVNPLGKIPKCNGVVVHMKIRRLMYSAILEFLRNSKAIIYNIFFSLLENLTKEFGDLCSRFYKLF